MDVLLVFGYGCRMTPELVMYLEKVVGWCNSNHPETVIYSGADTNRQTEGDTTEAGLMMDYIARRLDYTPLHLKEEGAHTTVENIQNCAHLVKVHGGPNARVTVACEATRALGIRVAALICWGRSVNLVTEKFDTTWLGLKSPILAMYNLVLLALPGAKNLMHATRVRRANRT